MSRLALLLLAATAILAGCEEHRTVYRDRSWSGGNRVVCDPDDEVCYKRGRPNREATRDMYGKKAVRRAWD